MPDEPIELTGAWHQNGRLVDFQALDARRTFRQQIAGLRIGSHERGGAEERQAESRVLDLNALEHRRPEHPLGQIAHGRSPRRRQRQQRLQHGAVVAAVEQAVHPAGEGAGPHQRRIRRRCLAGPPVDGRQARRLLDPPDDRPQLLGCGGSHRRRLGHEPMRLLLHVVRGEGHWNPRNVLRLDVPDDRPVGSAHQQRQPETAVQESVEVSRPDERRIGHDLEYVLRRPHSDHLRAGVGHPADGSRA